MSLKKIINRYMVTIVMIPSIIGIHYAWTRVQNVESLVKEHEKQDLPIIIGAKRLYNEYINKPANDKKDEER